MNHDAEKFLVLCDEISNETCEFLYEKINSIDYKNKASYLSVIVFISLTVSSRMINYIAETLPEDGAEIMINKYISDLKNLIKIKKT